MGSGFAERFTSIIPVLVQACVMSSVLISSHVRQVHTWSRPDGCLLLIDNFSRDIVFLRINGFFSLLNVCELDCPDRVSLVKLV